MTPVRQYFDLLRIQYMMNRQMVAIISIIQAAMTVGLILGFGYYIPDINKTQALFLTVGAATQTVVTIGVIMLPQKLSQEKSEGLLDYFLTLPIGRENYLLAEVSFVALMTFPGTIFAVAFGAWHYDLSLSVNPVVIVAAVLAVFSLAGLGVAMPLLSPYQQLTNALTQLLTFYILLFSPVLMPKEQLPWLLQKVAVVMPPTYAADAMRASLTDLPGTHLARSLLVMAGFGAVFLGASAMSIRRRG
ncbi:MAG: ABC transporter permease [Chloroflexi bacterium]|nr:ABC transporter permease [Chloroflexota bacterium]